jgi:glycosyltransferase involved in cell wall biosynthesis
MASSAKLVTVIVPCRNAEGMLRAALLSIVKQTHPGIEVIFVDNNSSDQSLKIAEDIAASSDRPIHITHCAEKGQNHARIWGYQFARGDFIQWMDADDLIDADKIARQVAALEQNSNYEIAYGDWTAHRMGPDNRPSIRRNNLSQVDDQVHRALAGIWYPNHLYLIRRSAADRLQELGAWFPERQCATDIEYSAFAALLGLRFLYVAGAHATYNIWSATQMSNTSYRERVAVLEAIYLRLRQFAAGQTNVKLTERHQILLNQNWAVWRMPASSVVLIKLGQQDYKLRHRISGAEIQLQAHEATIIKGLTARPAALTFAHWAVLLTMQHTAELGDDPVTVIDCLQRLQAEGFLLSA